MSLALRMKCVFVLVVLILATCISVVAQTETATLSGVIQDPKGGVAPDVEVTATRIETGIAVTTKTNGAGIYFFTALVPGHYHLVVRKPGFKEIAIKEFELFVQDKLEQNFSLEIGSVSETVTVNAATPLVNTTDASVSTVIDRQFVENMPLNGRSFQTLIALSPGVVLVPASFTNQGQFSVNGQRSNANYFTVDGVSANAGVSSGFGLTQTAGGSLPGLTTGGGTNGLVSVDAMQEFRIQTSTFAPEFGRTPGGQISIVTRSGSNQFHGTLFDYFRNDVLDARDWFVSRDSLAKPEERQNDFGGVVGGPIIKENTFFFFSYEGLRLRQPSVQQTGVPSMASRLAAPSEIQPFLNAYPVPNGPDLGNGFTQFNASYSNPTTLNAYSIRVDHAVNSKVNLFGRYTNSPSDTVLRGPFGVLSNTESVQVKTQTLTLGSSQSLSQRISNEVRANYSNFKSGSQLMLDNFGGATPLPDSLLFPIGFSSRNGLSGLNIAGIGTFYSGRNSLNEQRQINLLDNLSVTADEHELKFGVDYRWLAPISGPRAYLQSALFSGISGPTGALSGTVESDVIQANNSTALLAQNFSFYGQDTWKVTPRLTLTYGLRWDINPALRGKTSKNDPITVTGLDNPATMTLAPQGTALYHTTHGNVAPRVGVAYRLTQNQGWGTVVRGGFGEFFDLGFGSLGSSIGFPFTATNFFASVPFPLTAQQAAPPSISNAPPVTGTLFAADPNLGLPRTYQWNVAIEQSLGISQSLSATYVGALGRDLLRQDFLAGANADFPGLVSVTRNTGNSDYHALQIKFERRFSRGLQAIASYSFSHSIDNASNDSDNYTPAAVANVNVDRGNSDFDVRHSFTGALTYDIPSFEKRKIMRAVLGGWSLDSFVTARSALPVNVTGPEFVIAGTDFVARENVVSGQPFYLYGSQYPGGKAFNITAFMDPPFGQQGDLGRNALRGFGAWQTDLAVRRQFHFTENVGLQFSAEMFNIFNHPNFGNPTGDTTNPLFGVSTQTLASSLGSGGLSGGFNPLYQIGGPRSIQLALKLQF
jgi:hypothetical protein